MSATIIPFPRPAASAYIERLNSKWRITLRNSPVGVNGHEYVFADPERLADFATTLRHHGYWRLTFGPGTAHVQDLINEMTEGGAA